MIERSRRIRQTQNISEKTAAEKYTNFLENGAEVVFSAGSDRESQVGMSDECQARTSPESLACPVDLTVLTKYIDQGSAEDLWRSTCSFCHGVAGLTDFWKMEQDFKCRADQVCPFASYCLF
jgi:hypothetical protein